MPRLVRFVIAVVGCLGVVAGVLMPLGVSARPGGSVLTAATKATGTLEVTVYRSGTYTVTGQGIRQRAHKSRTFYLRPGVYTVTAADATVTPKKVRVGRGTTSAVTVVFHGVPLLASALVKGGGPCAVLQDGKLACWENELWPDPKTVKGISNPLAVDGPGCAVLSDGTVKCWGRNDIGQLGNGTTDDSRRPVQVTGISTATGISVGWAHRCAVLSDGTVRCWGGNSSGQLGNGTKVSSSTPVPVTGITTATAVSAGDSHTCALLSDGTVQCWGANNNSEQLGIELPPYDVSTPVAVPGISGVTAISAGYGHTCALRFDHTVYCWGGYEKVPVPGIENATAISAGRLHSCALLSDGTLRCWGDNSEGQLGDGTRRTSSTVPVTVTGITTATAVLADDDYTCARLSDATVTCWGSGYEADVPGTYAGSSVPWRVKGVGHVKAIAMGAYHSCVLLPDGKVKCWGDNEYQQLGNGTREDSWTPVAANTIRMAKAITAGAMHTCVLLPGGRVKCWGCLRWGFYGCDGPKEASAPVRVPGIPKATAITAGYVHTCVLLSGGAIKCWGNNGGTLGNGKGRNSDIPVPVVGIRNAIAVSAWADHTCAVLSDGTVKCWGCVGPGCSGGDPDYERVIAMTPRLIQGVHNATAITTGYDHSCALLSTKAVSCWGFPADDEYGEYDTPWTAVPIIGLGRVRAISAGGGSTYAMLANGKIKRWAGNGKGQGSAPVLDESLGRARVVATGGDHTCAVLTNRTVKCWGSNGSGQLGRPPLRQYDPKVLITRP